MRRYALFVTGAPATGKSFVAGALARALPNFALLEKDVLKEALFDALQGNDCMAETASRRLSDGAMRLLWALAPRCPRVILEANFRTLDRAEKERFQTLDANKIELHCRCQPEVAMRRFAARASSRHPAHTVKELSRQVYEESEAPFGLGPLIEVDTTHSVDVDGLLQQVHGFWPDL